MEGRSTRCATTPQRSSDLGIDEIVDHYDSDHPRARPPPIIMGHSFGGAFTQMLLDRGLGAAGVAIDAAAVKGISRLPFVELRSGVPGSEEPGQQRTAPSR